MFTVLKKAESILRRKIKGDKKLCRFYRQQERFKKVYPNYEIGVGSYFGSITVHDYNNGTTLKIGSYCSIATNVNIFLGGHHRVDWVSTYPFPAYVPNASYIKDSGGTHGNVIVGSDVWICANTTILSGVTIGDGAVIANSAVVTKDVEPYSIVAGNPAKVIKYRFDKDTIARLLQIKWWDWDPEEVISHPELFCSDSFLALFEYADKRQLR